MAHFKPFARAEAGAPSHRRDKSYDSYDDSSYRRHRRYRRYRHRGLLGDLLGL